MSLLESVGRDVRYALRLLRRDIGLTTFAILSLSLATGGAIAVFSVMYTFLKPLPVFQPDRLVEVAHTRGVNLHSYAMWRQVRERQDVFSGIFAYYVWDDSLDLREGGNHHIVGALFVSGEAFRVLGVPAALGRTLVSADDEPGAAPVCMIGYGLWERQYGQSPRVLGHTMVLKGHVFQVVGVAPRWFFGIEIGTKPEVFLPLEMRRTFTSQHFGGGVPMPTLDAGNALGFIGRLKTGMSVAQADARLRVLGREIYDSLPAGQSLAGTLMARPLPRGELWSYSKDTVVLMMVMAGVLLFIACANLGNLLLARAAARQGEMGARLAMGATRGRLVRQLLTESVVLSVAAAAGGLIFATWARQAVLLAISIPGSSAILDFSIDAKLLAFTIGVALLCVLLFGLTPAVSATRVSLYSAMNDGAAIGKRRSQFSNSVLIVVQVALSVPVFVSACLLARTYHNLLAKDPGYEAKGVLVAQVDLTEAKESQRAAFEGNELLEAFRRMPGVVSASRLANSSRGNLAQLNISQSGDSVLRTRAYRFYISADYFRTRRAPILAGRDFDRDDTEGSIPVAILSQQAARAFFKGVNPIGLSFRESDFSSGGQEHLVKVVGVVKDMDFQRPQDAPLSVIFRPASQCSECLPMGRYEIRFTGPLRAMATRLKASASTVDSDLAMELHPLADEINDGVELNRTAASLSALFGSIVGLLTMIGVYAMTSYAAAQRTREIGIRMAMGAQPGNVLRMILHDSLGVVFVGILLGVLAAWGAVQTIRGMLWGVEPIDPRSFAAAVGLVLLAAGVAAFLPARSAMRSDPMACLRYE